MRAPAIETAFFRFSFNFWRMNANDWNIVLFIEFLNREFNTLW